MIHSFKEKFFLNFSFYRLQAVFSYLVFVTFFTSTLLVVISGWKSTNNYFKDNTFVFPVSATLLALTAYTIYRLGFDIRLFVRNVFICLVGIPISGFLFPIIPEKYVLFEYVHIQSDTGFEYGGETRYCYKDEESMSALESRGYRLIGGSYSWKSLELRNHSPSAYQNNFITPFDSDFTFAAFIILESMFQTLPCILLLTIGVVFFPRRFRFTGLISTQKEELIHGKYNIDKMFLISKIAVAIVVIYNVLYILAFSF